MKTSTTILKNGIRLVTIPMVDNPAVTVLVMVSTGSKYETKEQGGLSHFIEHMLFKGTTQRPSPLIISTELDSIGSDYNAFTGQEYTGYYAKSSPEHLPKIVDVIADMYLNPLFDEKEMEKEKGVIIEEIRMYRDLPQRHVHSLFMELVYGDQPAGRDIAGTEETVKSFARKDFLEYRDQHYVGSATTIVVAGTFDAATIEQLISEKFATILTKPKAQKELVQDIQTQPAIKIEKRPTDQTHLVLGVRTFAIGDTKSRTLRLISGVLGAGLSSRLTQKFRDEMGVCYYIHASNDLYTDHGLFTVSAGVPASRLAEVVKELLIELKRLTTELVSPEELKKTQDYLAGTMQLGLETSDARADFVGHQYVLRNTFKTPDEITAELRAVTPEMIRGISQEIFVTKNLNLAVIGNVENETEIKALLNF